VCFANLTEHLHLAHESESPPDLLAFEALQRVPHGAGAGVSEEELGALGVYVC